MPLPTMDGATSTRAVTLADIRFSQEGDLRRAQLLSFDLRNLNADRRLNMMDNGDSTLWIVVGVVAAGVAICLLADCFDGGSEDRPD